MMMTSKRFLRVALCAVVAFLFAATTNTAQLYAQSSASLSGTVLDPRGAVLPGATVTVKGDAGAPQKVTSDSQGKYSFSLPAGKYTVQVDDSGFATAEKAGVQLTAGQSVDVPVTPAAGPGI